MKFIILVNVFVATAMFYDFGHSQHTWNRIFCCSQEALYDFSLKIYEKRRTCMRKVQEDPEFSESLGVAACTAMEMNLLSSDGRPIEAAYRELVAETMAKEAWFQEIQDDVIAKCLNDTLYISGLENLTFKIKLQESSRRLIYCLMDEVQLRCPSEEIKYAERCAEVRAHIDEREMRLKQRLMEQNTKNK